MNCKVSESPITKPQTQSPPQSRRLSARFKHLIKKVRQARPFLKLARLAGRPMPDDLYLALGHLIYFGRWPDYAAPKTFNEHIQAYMLRCRDPILHIAADKASIRSYVANLVGEQYLVECLGIWERAEDVPLQSLPTPCVLKASVGSGMVLFLNPGAALDVPDIRDTLRKWLKRDYSGLHREWCYKDLPRRILAEKTLLDEDGQVPADYKVYVIGKQVRFIQVDRGRFSHHTRNLYSSTWDSLQARLTLENHAPDPKPQCLEDMLRIAHLLAQPFEFLRVDFYVVQGRLYVGELTNYPGAGFEKFIPASFALELGAHWNSAPQDAPFQAMARDGLPSSAP